MLTQMIKYHGTPIGGDRLNASRFFTARNALVSFKRPEDLPVILECCQSFVIDNGAFTHFNEGKGLIDVEAYIKFVELYSKHPAFTWCLIPDKIDGTEDENFKMVQSWLLRKPAAKGIPVFHLHESTQYLKYLISKFDTIAIGSSGEFWDVGSQIWFERMNIIFAEICDEDGRPLVKVHGLRMLDPEVFTKFPFSSADSTNAARHGGSLSRFGMYKPPNKWQRQTIIADRVERFNSAPVYINQPYQEYFLT